MSVETDLGRLVLAHAGAGLQVAMNVRAVASGPLPVSNCDPSRGAEESSANRRAPWVCRGNNLHWVFRFFVQSQDMALALRQQDFPDVVGGMLDHAEVRSKF
jgi:hypothetical protein